MVSKAEIEIATSGTYNHEYIPVTGIETFTRAATELLLGSDSVAIKEKRAIGVQAIAGTGALRLGAEFLHKHLGRNVVYYSNPTWENHHKVFFNAGFTTIEKYRYWCPEKRGLDFEGDYQFHDVL